MQLLDPALVDAEDDNKLLTEAMASRGLIKQSVDDWLNSVDYGELNSGHFMPGTFALKFMNFIKLVNGEEGEQNHTPVVHLAMLDQIAGQKKRIANLCHRGIAKTTLMFEFIRLPSAVPGSAHSHSVATNPIRRVRQHKVHLRQVGKDVPAVSTCNADIVLNVIPINARRRPTSVAHSCYPSSFWLQFSDDMDGKWWCRYRQQILTLDIS